MTDLAISRRSDVVSRVEGDETLVLDLQTKTAHCLSGDVAAVWNADESSVSAIAAGAGLSESAVEAAVASLVELGLVSVSSGMSRRLLVRGAAVGGALVAAGAVSIPLPAAANAASASFTLTRPGNCNANSTASLLFSVASGRLSGPSTYVVALSSYFTKADHSTSSTSSSVTLTTNSSGNITGAGATGAVTVQSFTATSVTLLTSSKYFGLTSSTVTVARTAPVAPPDSNSFTANAPTC